MSQSTQCAMSDSDELKSFDERPRRLKIKKAV